MSSSKISIVKSVKRQLTELNCSLKNKKLKSEEFEHINNKISCLENVLPELEKQLDFNGCFDYIVGRIEWYKHMGEHTKIGSIKVEDSISVLTKLL